MGKTSIHAVVTCIVLSMCPALRADITYNFLPAELPAFEDTYQLVGGFIRVDGPGPITQANILDY